MMAGSRMIIAAIVFILSIGGAAAVSVAQDPYSWACESQAGEFKLKGCADSSCNPIQSNLGGAVLVLATGSMLRTPPGSEPLGATPAECCSLCRTTDMCNAWVYCNKKEGCGSPNSCSAYMASLSPMSYANGIQGLVPAAGWGRFGSGCLPDGRWPYRTCSLKQVADTVNPPAWGQGSGSEGWISGVTPKPSSNISGCINGFTDLTCKTCIATRNPMLCFSCMQGSTSWRGGPPQCAACANGGRCQTL